MRITFTLLSQQTEILHIDCPPDEQAGQLTEKEFERPIQNGKLAIRQTLFSGASLILTTIEVKKPSTLNVTCDCFCWVMNFVLDGELGLILNNKDFKLTEGRYHTFYTTSFYAGISCKQSVSMLSICLNKAFIQKISLNNNLPCGDEESLANGFKLLTKGHHYKGKISLLLHDILNAGQPGYIKRIYLEAKILELFSLQLEQLETRQPSAENINTDDTGRLHEAKLLIEQNLKTPCSLTELSRKTGLNDFKLKKGFKALFGNTVFGYLGELRMTKAYQLLQNGERVGIVAEAVGYKNPHHFTAAFKKRFNVLPSQVMSSLVVLLNLLYCF